MADLLSSFISEAVAYSKKPKKVKAALARKDKPAPIPRRLSPLWKYQAVILPVQRTYCSCGATYEAPLLPMIKRYHPNFGFHSEVISTHGTVPEHLDHRLEYLDHSVAHCQRCFNPEQFQPEAQLSLPFSDEENHPYRPEPSAPPLYSIGDR